VEEAGWARVGGRGGDGEEPTVASSVEVDPAAMRLWAADMTAEAPPEPRGMGRRRGKKGEVRKGGEGGRGGRRADGTAARSPPAAVVRAKNEDVAKWTT
jgi:hypothetical protein